MITAAPARVTASGSVCQTRRSRMMPQTSAVYSSGAMRDTCDGFVTIPTAGGASSLSLSHAGAIVLAEALRQRTPRIEISPA